MYFAPKTLDFTGKIKGFVVQWIYQIKEHFQWHNQQKIS